MSQLRTRTVSGTSFYSIDEDTDEAVLVTVPASGMTVNLPDARLMREKQLRVARANAANGGTATVATVQSQTISGASSVALTVIGDSLLVVSDGSNWQQLAAPLGGSISAVKYKLVSDGTTVTAYDQTGSTLYSGLDAGAALTACLPAASSLGATIDFRNDGNVFPWGSVPALPKGITNQLTIRGNGSTVQLSAAGPRFLDFNKVADYDVFQNIELDGFVVDCNSVGGKHHVVIGTYQSGVNQTRLNFQNIYIRRIRTINVPVDPTVANARLNIYIDSQHLATAEGTQTYLKSITVKDCRFEGGHCAVALRGSNQTSGTANNVGVNVVGDDLNVIRVWHSMLTAPTAGFSSEHIQIGQAMLVESCRVEDCYGYGSGDVGVEIDNAAECVVRDCLVEEAWNQSYLLVNYNAPTNVDEQNVRFVRCKGRRLSAAQGFWGKISKQNSLDFGQVVFEDCSWYSNTTDMPGVDAFQTLGSPNVQKLVLERFHAVCENRTNGASNLTPVVFSFAFGTATSNLLIVRNCHATYTGTKGAGTLTWVGAQVLGTCQMDVDGMSFNGNIASASAASMRYFSVGVGTAALHGSIRRVKCAAHAGGDTTPQLIRVGGTGTLTVTDLIKVEDCDSTQFPSGGALIAYAATSNAAAFNLSGNHWFTRPAPASLTGLTTATGAAITTGWKAIVQFLQGSGAAVTAIDISTNGGTTYTNVLTQASGALPAGADIVVGPVTSDTLVKVTFTTTQPTIKLIPVDA